MDVVFLGDKEISTYDYDNPFLQDFIRKYNVSFVNVGEIVFEGVPTGTYGDPRPGTSLEIKSVNELTVFLRKLDKSSTVIVVRNPRFEARQGSEVLFRAISESSIPYVLTDLANSFSPRQDFYWIKSCLGRFGRKTPLGYRNRRYWFWNQITRPTFVLSASRMIEDQLKIRGVRSRFVRAHSRDYESFLVDRRRGAVLGERLRTRDHRRSAVFIDQGRAGDGDDHKYLKDLRYPAYGDYYGEVGIFMERIRKLANVDEIVVALHPSNFRDPEQISLSMAVPNCRVVKGRTAAEIANADIVVTEASSATSIAALYEKLLCFFLAKPEYTHEILLKGHHNYAALLGRRLNFVDDEQIEFGFDSTKSRKFVRRYVKEPDTKDASIYRILDLELERVFSG